MAGSYLLLFILKIFSFAYRISPSELSKLLPLWLRICEWVQSYSGLCWGAFKEIFWILLPTYLGLPRWLSGEESACQCKRCEFDPWFGNIPWRRKWQPTPVFLPGEFHGQRSLKDYSPLGPKESDMTEQLSTKLFKIDSMPFTLLYKYYLQI